MNNKYIVALDQGTTSTRTVVFDVKNLEPQFIARREFPQYFPNEGWVEHNVEDIWNVSTEVLKEADDYVSSNSGEVVSLGITNQRETCVLWDKETGKPLHNAIVWLDRRTADRCDKLREDGVEEMVKSKTGLPLDAYFSSTKLTWLLEKTNSYERAQKGEVLAGTIDSFLVWRLTKGQEFATDVSNASRTQLCSLATLDWDEELLKLHNVPIECLPKIKDNADNFGTTDVFGSTTPICGVAGDQQAAAIGQACINMGETKSTYGTGCFVIAQGGDTPVIPKGGLLGTVGYKVGDRLAYALEGSIFVAGASIKWLRDNLGVLKSADESAKMAKNANKDSQVYLVPAFTGLGAPHWNPHARGTLLGMTLDTDKADIAHATLASITYQSNDLFEQFAKQGITPAQVNIDGGMSANDWFAQYLSDIISTKVSRPVNVEATATGVAFLAGLYVGVYSSLDDVAKLRKEDKVFIPSMDEQLRQEKLKGWQKAVRTTLFHSKKN